MAFSNPEYKNLAQIWAKTVILGWSVKYTILTGGRKMTLRPKSRVALQNFSKKSESEKKLVGSL